MQPFKNSPFAYGAGVARSEVQVDQGLRAFMLGVYNNMTIGLAISALVALGVHAWVGMWTISTDYLTPMALGKWATVVRFLFQGTCGVAMFTFFVWGVQILWGI